MPSMDEKKMHLELIGRIKRFGWCKTTEVQLDALLKFVEEKHKPTIKHRSDLIDEVVKKTEEISRLKAEKIAMIEKIEGLKRTLCDYGEFPKTCGRCIPCRHIGIILEELKKGGEQDE